LTGLALCRFVHFLAAMLAFGASLFLAFDAPDALRRALSPRIRGPVLAASVIGFASACLWLALQAAAMADDPAAATDPEAILAVLTDTAFGRAWSLHLLLCAAFVAIALTGARDGWRPIAAFAGLALASLGLVGHAAMQSGALGALHRANHALHLLAGGAWIGGLIPFVLSLDASSKAALRRDAVTAMTRFSLAGHVVVGAIVLTGIADVAMTSGHPPLPPSTPYRALLCVKLALVAVMIGLALVNRYVLVPRLSASARAFTGLRAASLVNVALGTVVVALASVFALLDPA